MNFMEELPQEGGVCPPAEAHDKALEGLYRIVNCENPTLNDFKSHKALGIPRRPTVSACVWAACSMFKSRDKAMDVAARLPKARYGKPHLALVNLDEGVGRSLVNEKTHHVSFWMSVDFDLAASLVMTEPI